MKNKLLVQLIVGIVCIVAGFLLIVIDALPVVVPGSVMGIGSGLVATWFAMRKHVRGDTFVYDEMTKRIDALSGLYTSTLTLYFLFVLMIVNYFIPIQLDTSWLLLTITMFLSISMIMFRYILSKYGRAE